MYCIAPGVKGVFLVQSVSVFGGQIMREAHEFQADAHVLGEGWM
jgi:hypothetical protein